MQPNVRKKIRVQTRYSIPTKTIWLRKACEGTRKKKETTATYAFKVEMRHYDVTMKYTMFAPTYASQKPESQQTHENLSVAEKQFKHWQTHGM